MLNASNEDNVDFSRYPLHLSGVRVASAHTHSDAEMCKIRLERVIHHTWIYLIVTRTRDPSFYPSLAFFLVPPPPCGSGGGYTPTKPPEPPVGGRTVGRPDGGPIPGGCVAMSCTPCGSAGSALGASSCVIRRCGGSWCVGIEANALHKTHCELNFGEGEVGRGRGAHLGVGGSCGVWNHLCRMACAAVSRLSGSYAKSWLMKS